MEPIQTQSEYLAAGGKPEAYAGYVAKRTEELEASVRSGAEAKAVKTVRVRVRAGGWPRGCTHYRVPAKAPFDPRLKPGEQGYEAPYQQEPALALAIGKVESVPVRDERHLAALRADSILEFVPDGTPTWQEEQVQVDAAVAAVRARGILAAPPPQPKDALAVPEKDALALVAAEGDVPVLLGWLAAADKAAKGTLARAVVQRLDELGGMVEAALMKRDRQDPPGPAATPGFTGSTAVKADEKPVQHGKLKGR